jgi:hypothetical protein
VALEQERQQLPPWLVVQTAVVVVLKYGRAGRPRQDAQPIEQEWHVQGQLELDPTPSNGRCDGKRPS